MQDPIKVKNLYHTYGKHTQNPELLILDDYSMGLDAGYRRFFLDYLTEYVANGKKTVFVASYITLISSYT